MSNVCTPDSSGTYRPRGTGRVVNVGSQDPQREGYEIDFQIINPENPSQLCPVLLSVLVHYDDIPYKKDHLDGAYLSYDKIIEPSGFPDYTYRMIEPKKYVIST